MRHQSDGSEFESNLQRVRKEALPYGATLVVVSKKRSLTELQHAYALGCRDFGESRLQEALEKIPHMPKDCRWHFVGRLQKNKVAKALPYFSLFHSIDTWELAQKMDEASGQQNLITSILLQVNTSGEKTKAGLSSDEWRRNILNVKELKNIQVKGLMTMAPLHAEEAVIRHCFRELKKLKDEWGLEELSMGMSGDYQIALEEGATFIRIGSALFNS